jgi:hypothetical protein
MIRRPHPGNAHRWLSAAIRGLMVVIVAMMRPTSPLTGWRPLWRSWCPGGLLQAHLLHRPSRATRDKADPGAGERRAEDVANGGGELAPEFFHVLFHNSMRHGLGSVNYQA